jgi:hypothetical protein
MKTILIAILLMLPALASAEKKATSDSAEYTVTVHVQSSHVLDTYMKSSTVQHLDVLIDGKKYELECAGGLVVPVGDYKAKISQEKISPNHEYSRGYQLLFSDGSTRKYGVVGESE